MTYTKEVQKEIAEAKKNTDINIRHEKLVHIVAKSEKVPDNRLINVERDADGRPVHKTGDGEYYYLSARGQREEDLLARHVCIDVSSAPGSAVVRTSTGVFTFDGTAEDFDTKQAEFNVKVEEERARLRREGGTPKRTK